MERGKHLMLANEGSWHSLPESKRGSIYCSEIRELATTAGIERGKHLLLGTKGVGIHCMQVRELAFTGMYVKKLYYSPLFSQQKWIKV